MTDSKVVLAVVCLIGAFACGGLAGVIWLIAVGAATEAVAIVSGLTGTALGGLATLLASTRSAESQPMPVNVVNETSEPVPVEPA